MNHPDCQSNAAPFFQCCCTCVYLREVHYHCNTEPKPSLEQKQAAGVIGKCICDVVKGFACCGPVGRGDGKTRDHIYDNWPEHSCGCEEHTTIEDLRKWRESNKLNAVKVE